MCVCTDLLVGELEAKLLNTALDGVPAGQTVTDGDVASETEVLGLEDLVRRRVVEDRLGVDARLVRERAVARDGVHERHVHLDRLRDEVLDLAQHGEVVLGLDVFGVRSIETCYKAAECCDTDALADAKDG